jgi:hypothetical protein
MKENVGDYLTNILLHIQIIGLLLMVWKTGDLSSGFTERSTNTSPQTENCQSRMRQHVSTFGTE